VGGRRKLIVKNITKKLDNSGRAVIIITLKQANLERKNEMKKFEANTEISARSICDHECIFEATVLKRTAKTVTIKYRGEEKRCKIHVDSYDGGEYIFPMGQYSMAPIMRAR
jgi:hypothetical protein